MTRRSGLVRHLAAIASLAVAAAGSGCSGDADFSDVMPAPVTLSAEEYKSDLMAIDRLAFQDAPMTAARRTALAGRLEELAKRIVVGSDSKFLKLESLEIRHLASIARDLPDEKPPRGLLDNWMRLRANLFDDQWWMARSAKDLSAEPLQVAPGRPGSR